MLHFKCLPDSQIYPWGVTSYFSSFPNGKKKFTELCSPGRQQSKWVEGKTHQDEQHQQLPQLLLRSLERLVLVWAEGLSESIQSVLVPVRSWKKAASSMEMISGQMVALVSAAGGKSIRAALRRAWAGLLRPLVTPLGVDTGLPAPSHDMHLSPGTQNPLQRQECKNSP